MLGLCAEQLALTTSNMPFIDINVLDCFDLDVFVQLWLAMAEAKVNIACVYGPRNETSNFEAFASSSAYGC